MKMDFFRNYFQENFLDGFDRDLQTFYNEVLNKELNLSDQMNVLQIRQSLKEVVTAYKKETVDSFSSSILFDSSAKRCAYVLKHCPCFTSAVARHFLRLFRSNPHILQAAMQRRRINVCCLGGGPATDAVAVIKIVNAVNSFVKNGHKEKLNIKISVVDLSDDWQIMASKVLETLQEKMEFCDTERMSVSFDFLKADLTEEWENRVKIVLRDADIVTMVYFVSAVNGSKAANKCCSMLQNVMQTLKPGALLFFLDSAKEMHYRNILLAALSFKNLKQIYGPHLQEFHTLSMKSIKKFIELYSDQYNITTCLTNCFTSCAVWIKTQTILSDLVTCNSNSYCGLAEKLQFFETLGSKRLPSMSKTSVERKIPEISACKIMGKGQNSWHKMMEYNTWRQVRFRQKIENLFWGEFEKNFVTEDLDDENSELDCLACGEKTLYAAKSKCKRIFT